MVWLGTARPLATTPRPTVEDPVTGWAYLGEVAAAAPVRARFTSPHVTYVGSHEGCGCGFQSEELAWQGALSAAEARALRDGLRDDERAAFDAEDGSRARLRALIEAARAWGPVELFACWAGDEGEPALTSTAVEPAWLGGALVPFAERAHYVISAAPG